MVDSNATLVYLDTNAYSRPFDDQMQPDIQAEANAFLEIIAEVKNGKLLLLGSDILDFEVHNVLNEEKRTWIEDYLSLCHTHTENSEDLLNLGKQIQNGCYLRARDALHIASAIIGQARYFLSCDKKVIEMKQASILLPAKTKLIQSEYSNNLGEYFLWEKAEFGLLKKRRKLSFRV